MFVFFDWFGHIAGKHPTVMHLSTLPYLTNLHYLTHEKDTNHYHHYQLDLRYLSI